MNNLFGQSEKNNSFEEYEFEIIFWLDSINVKQKQYYPNKSIKLEYDVINDSIKIRKEYFESGNIKLEAEVYQRFKKSIKTSPKESNNEEDTTIIKEGYVDVRHGKYIEYYDDILKLKRQNGKYKDNTRCSEWTKYDISMRKIIIENYNDKGFLEGKYTEYFFVNGSEELKKVKTKGQYEVITYNYAINDNERYFITESKKTGIWEYYDWNKLIEKVNYEIVK